MTISINETTISGNLTKDVSFKQLGDDRCVANFSIAHNRRYTKNGEKCEETTYVDVTVWNQQATNCERFLSKGKPCLVQGSLRQESWTDKEGNNKSKIVVLARRVHFLGGNQDSKAPAQEHQDIATGYSVSNSMGGSDSEEDFSPF